MEQIPVITAAYLCPRVLVTPKFKRGKAAIRTVLEYPLPPSYKKKRLNKKNDVSILYNCKGMKVKSKAKRKKIRKI